jgi:hypothetical protein
LQQSHVFAQCGGGEAVDRRAAVEQAEAWFFDDGDAAAGRSLDLN